MAKKNNYIANGKATAEIEKCANGVRRDEDSDEEDGTETPEEEILFRDMSPVQKAKSVFMVFLKLIGFLICLYVFICSLGLLESAFQLLGGKTAGEAFGSGVLSNPFAGLVIGVLATILVQSSSTSTSIVVTMVGSKIIPVEKAVPIVMGTNIGTSVTNTLVSVAQVSNRNQFRRAFAGATVHDMFNWLSVIVLLPLEIACGYLHKLTSLMVEGVGNPEDVNVTSDKPPEMLKAITQPVISRIVEINQNVINDVAANGSNTGDVLKRWCKTGTRMVNESVHHNEIINFKCQQLLAASPLRVVCGNGAGENSSVTVEWNTLEEINETEYEARCDSLFAQTDLNDAASGAILLVCSLILLLGALIFIVKILNSLLSGSVTKIIKKFINSDFPGPFAYFTPYVALLVGCGMTIVVQSSSVFTSTLTPMVGLGIVSVERMYPMTLGANVGTTITAILAALSQSNDHMKNAFQIALCHLFFNISGIILFFPIPFMRWPIGLAKALGKTTSKHRWFAIVYLIFMFIVLPGTVFGLSSAGWVYLGAIGGPIFFILLVIAIINVVQKKRPSWLPKWLRDWDFLPLCCHSLKPVDRLIERVFRCKYCQTLQEAPQDDGPDGVRVELERDETAPTDDAESIKLNSVSGSTKLSDNDPLQDSIPKTNSENGGIVNGGFPW